MTKPTLQTECPYCGKPMKAHVQTLLTGRGKEIYEAILSGGSDGVTIAQLMVRCKIVARTSLRTWVYKINDQIKKDGQKIVGHDRKYRVERLL